LRRGVPVKTCPKCNSTYPTQFTVCPHDAETLQEVSELGPGAILRGKYKILEKIGEGGMGAVYKALHLRFNEVCALKIVLPYHLQDPSFVQRFNAEAVLMRRLDHPHALRINDVDETEDGRPFFVMEYIEGESLEAVLARGALPPVRAIGIMIQACDALAAAHRLGVIHRDIKPANLILARTADGSDSVKVLDFGIAKVKAGSPLRDGASLTQTGAIVGTPTYMSPEQCQGAHGDQLTDASDLYSLGVVLYQMLTGSVPFKADTAVGMLMAHLQQSPPDPRVLVPSVPPQLVSVVFRALEKNPAKRFASADEMRKALEDANSALGKTTVGSLRAVKLEPAVAPLSPPSRPVTPVPVAPTPPPPAPEERIVAPPPPTPLAPEPAPQPPPSPPTPQPAPQSVRAAAPSPAVPGPPVGTSRPRTNRWLIFGGGVALLAIIALLAVLFTRTGRIDTSNPAGGERAAENAAGPAATSNAPVGSPESEPRKLPSPAAATPPVGEKPSPAPGGKPAEGAATPTTQPNPTPPQPAALPPVIVPQFVLLETLEGHKDSVLTVAFSPNGRILASGGSDNTINLWDVATGQILHQLLGHTGQVFGVAFNPNGRILASASADHTVRLWDVAAGRYLVTYASHQDRVFAVAFSPDGLTLASASKDGTVKLWEVATGHEIRTLAGHSRPVTSVAFTPDSRMLASGSEDATIKIWDVASGREIRTLAGHSGLIHSVAFSPDGQMLASAGSRDQTVRIWDVRDGRELNTLTGHAGFVESVAFSPQGRILASGSEDATVRLWDVLSGHELTRLSGGTTSWVISVAYSRDGRLLASGGGDKSVRIWRVADLH